MLQSDKDLITLIIFMIIVAVVFALIDEGNDE